MFETIFTILVVLVMFVFLAVNVSDPVVVFLGGVTVLALGGVVSLSDVVAGFANEGMLTVAVLFVVAGAAQKCAFLPGAANRMLGDNAQGRWPLLKMALPVAGFSAFINNTPVVAICIPIVRSWSIRCGVSPSKLLLPLSYISIFGGLLTVIGTSTNLVVSGMLQEQGHRALGMFEITVFGLPLAIVGMVYLVLWGYRFLPDNQDLLETAKKNYREYLVTFMVEDGCGICGKTVEKAGLRNLQGLYLFEIIRDKRRIYPVTPLEVLQIGDKLIFTGQVDTILQVQNIPGLRLLTSADDLAQLTQAGEASMVEVVVSNFFPFLHQSIKESNFRSHYDAAVVAVIRQGERINDKIGNIVLRPGDTLLLLTLPHFASQWVGAKDFYFINQREQLKPVPRAKAHLVVLAFLLLVGLAGTGTMPTLNAAVLALCVIMLTKTISVKEALDSINWEVLIVIALSLGIGKALIESGAADMIASALIAMSIPLGPLGILAAVYIVTNLFTLAITNNAAAVLAFPIAYTAALQSGMDLRVCGLVVAVAASAAFATPFGYQTNLMVYGPGGYLFRDFMRVGLPLHILFFIVTMGICLIIA
jgi:di/tricarboxylate transporter